MRSVACLGVDREPTGEDQKQNYHCEQSWSTHSRKLGHCLGHWPLRGAHIPTIMACLLSKHSGRCRKEEAAQLSSFPLQAGRMLSWEISSHHSHGLK